MLTLRRTGLSWKRCATAAMACVLIGNWAGTSTALGQTTTPNRPNFKQNSNAAPVNTQVIGQLRSIRTLLEQADHDYQGHRAEAVHQITKALHALEGGKVPQQPPHPAALANGNGNNHHEKQSLSDAQLSQAIQQLQAIEAQLTGGQGRHVGMASQHVNRAIKDLQIALTIK